MNQQENQNPVILWVGKNFSKLEMTFVLAFMLGMMFKTAGFGPSGLFIGFGLTFLAVIYFLSAFIPDRQPDFMNVFMHKIMAVSWAMITVGIMFFYLGFSSYLNQLMAGLLALALSFIFFLISGIRTRHWINRSEWIRSGIILLAGIYIFMHV